MANYNEITDRNSPNFTAGRPGGGIKGITIHWWGDPNQNPTADGVVAHLCNPAAQVSAHIVATGTGRKVWQLVNDSDTAWHAGNWTGNITTIGIECDPRCRDEDYDVVAEVVADLWRYYGKLPLYPHKNWVSTACPGNYDLARIQREAELKLNPPAPVPDPEKLVWAAMSNPRKLVTKNSLTYVVDVLTGVQQGAPLSKGTPVEFATQATYNKVTYLRSAYATLKGFNWGIPQDLLEEVPVPPVEPPVVPPVEPPVIPPVDPPVTPPVTPPNEDNVSIIKKFLKWFFELLGNIINKGGK